jgi:hypothetical protein
MAFGRAVYNFSDHPLFMYCSQIELQKVFSDIIFALSRALAHWRRSRVASGAFTNRSACLLLARANGATTRLVAGLDSRPSITAARIAFDTKPTGVRQDHRAVLGDVFIE